MGTARQPDDHMAPGETGGRRERLGQPPHHRVAGRVLARHVDPAVRPRLAELAQRRHQPGVDDGLERTEGEATVQRRLDGRHVDRRGGFEGPR